MKTPENAVSVQLESKPVLTVDDLKDTDHIGIELKHSRRFEVIKLQNGHMNAFNGGYTEPWLRSMNQVNLSEVISLVSSQIIGIYKFNTRRDLYKWLSEE